MKDVKRHSLESSFSRVDSVETVRKLENVQRRRLKIRRMKYSCQAKIHGGDDFTVGTKTERPEIHESVEISLTLASSSSSEEEDRSTKRNDEDEDISYGSVSMIGCRKEMEDAVSVKIGFAVKESQKCDFFAVYDGHGGAQVAEVCRERLHQVVAEEMERCGNNVEWDWERVMEGCFGKMDREVASNAAVRTVGTTAVVAVMASREIVVANCGDSRAVLGRGGETVELSRDHKVRISINLYNYNYSIVLIEIGKFLACAQPERPDELMRIEEAGGRVINWNGHRVLGVLATSRSIGLFQILITLNDIGKLLANNDN